MPKRPIILNDNGQLQELPNGETVFGAVAAHSVNMTNGNASSIVFGSPVYVDGADSVDLAQADADGTSKVLGLVANATVASAASAAIQTDGVLTGTTTQWDAVTGGSGGLTPGAQYVLSPDTPGQLYLRTDPITSGEWMIPVGIALSDTDMLIDIEDGVKRA